MLEVDWDVATGWHNPKIIPYGNFSLSPAATALHYGIECFEGMKGYKDKAGTIRLFRPDKNMERLNHSMTRLGMPSIAGNDAFLQCIKQLLKVDESWIPDKEGYSIYLRPTAIGTSPFLGVHASEQIKLYVILSPVGPYYKSGFVPIKLFADTHNVRAWPGGVGNAKVGGNYGPTIEPSKKAASLGCSQVLWLFGADHQITEVGAMNIFFLLKKKGCAQGKLELVTAPLTRGDILPGVTRNSILALAREWGEFEVNERWLTMGEVAAAEKEGRLVEAFGAGTAVVISPVRSIIYEDKEIKVPTGDAAGPVASRLWKTLYDIQYGKVAHPWSVVV
jgi:branched-chain amino acid aminotransferase